MWTIDRFHEIALSLKPNIKDLPHHCTFVFDKKKLLAIGTNKRKTSPRNLNNGYFTRGRDVSDMVGTHSELAAIIRLGLEDCRHLTFVNIRIDHNNQIALSRPCKGCQNLLNLVGYKRILFTNNLGLLEKF